MSTDRDDPNNREYTNGDITVFWKPGLCIHATTCYKELIEVFNPRKRPWVDMKGASTGEIIRVVDLCPTKALSYKWNDDSKNKISGQKTEDVKPGIDTQPATEVRIMKDGPLIVKGDFVIKGSDGTIMKTMKMASFCRCGQSKKMPFCDGTHRKSGFQGE